MRRAIRTSLRPAIAILGLAAIALAVAGYVLANQRLRFPLLEEAPFTLKAEFSTAQAVTPGQGQTVRVSGVRVGDISKVELEEGRAVVTFELDPEFDDLVRTDATALLRPKTGLKDMFVELQPGTRRAPVAREGWTMPIRATQPDVNTDEVLAALDADTRDYVKLLVGDGAEGLRGRAGDLREVLRRFEPTHRDLARVNGAVAERASNLRRLVHALHVLNAELGGKDDELAELVGSSAKVLRAFAQEGTDVSAAVRELPDALRQTTDALGRVERFADVLTPAADELRPVARALTGANAQLAPFARETAPVLRDQVRPFVRQARPTVRRLDAPAEQLRSATPQLTRSFTVLNHLLNMVGFNPRGREGPAVKARDEGFLFWIAWLNHNSTAIWPTSDAHGPMRAGAIAATCGVLRQVASDGGNPLDVLLTPLLSDPALCPGTGGGG
ncbi:MlaD family protein [Conexibacter sp. SYSU D00693]|uniref:MlaD family protein n=1 Tax=Conexibacter sp. SYSU D00693 TaxID=2812560 RepID=UPI00196B0907|nr:MlaD family protein [Conexibacter sp. SYSU D00693]